MLLLEHLGLRRIQVLHSVSVRIPSAWWHASHESRGIHLGPGTRHTHDMLPY